MTDSVIKTVHSVYHWLTLTENWIYTLIRNLPPIFENHISCQQTVNLEQFMVPHIHTANVATVLDMTGGVLLHSHFADFGWMNLQAAQSHGVKHVVSFYGYDLHLLPALDPSWRERYAELFHQADLFLCEGEHMRRSVIALGCPPGKVRVCRLGVRLDLIPYRPRLWSRCEPLRVLICGSFREKKGIPYALEALSKIRGKVTGMEITVIGDSNPGDDRMRKEKESIVAVIDKCGLRDCTRLTGFQPHHTILQEAYGHHLFISPSITARDGDAEGGAPVTILEMAASGMPIVSTNHCDIPGLLGATNRSRLSPERDADQLAKQVELLLQMSSWEDMLLENREHIEHSFSAGKQGEELAGIYLELLRSIPKEE